MSAENQSNLTLCDYFTVIGFDKSAGLQIDKHAELASGFTTGSSKSESTKSPLDRAYEAKVLSYFPKHRDGFPFAQEIASLCMPKGLRFVTERKVPKEPSFHSFVLVREDGTRVNGCALIFYEAVLDCDIRQQIYELQLEYIREMAATTSTSYDGREIFTGSGEPSAAQFPPGTVSFGNHTLPRKLSSRSGRSPVPAGPGNSGEGGYSTSKSPRRQSHRNRKRISFYDSASKPIFVSKCICFVTRIPIVYSSENLLRSLWSMICGKFQYLTSTPLPIESILYWALHEVPLPIPGTCLHVTYGECNLVVKRPGGNEMLFFDYPIQILFNYISVEKFITLFTCFLLEHQILLCSKHMDRLMLVAECLSALIFPFRWQLTYVPILPYSHLKFIEAPVPYLMGLCYDERIPEQIFQSNVCIFDVDAGRLDHPEDIPAFPRQRQIIERIFHILHRYKPQRQNYSVVNPNNSSSSVVEGRSAQEAGGVVMRRGARSASKGGDVPPPSSSQRSRNDLWTMKRMSRSFDNNVSFADAAAASEEGSEAHGVDDDDASTSLTVASAIEGGTITDRSERDGDIVPNGGSTMRRDYFSHVDSYNTYLKGLKFNHAIRELFFCHFASLFASYEHFLIGAANGEKENRESMVNFDKASFLSDQPESYLPFLAAFLETQMFTSFVDAKILAHCHPHTEEARLLQCFDRRIAQLLITVGNDGNAVDASAPNSQSYRTPASERPLDFLFSSSAFLKAHEESLDAEVALITDYEVDNPHPLVGSNDHQFATSSSAPNGGSLVYGDVFPEMDERLFEVTERRSGADGRNDVVSSPWKQQSKKQRVLNVLEDASCRLVPSNTRFPGSDDSQSAENPMRMAHQNWRFVEQLLKETKTKTKRMLVAKMGKEAVHLGHGDLGITGVEENTLVAGFCDLLERVWAHGLKKKQGKSALWAHIFSHYDHDKLEGVKPIDRYSNMSPDSYRGVSELKTRLNSGGLASATGRRIRPLPSSPVVATPTLPFSDKKLKPPHDESEKSIAILQDDVSENSKALNDLMESIRSIARSLDVVPINDGSGGEETKLSGEGLDRDKENLLTRRTTPVNVYNQRNPDVCLPSNDNTGDGGSSTLNRLISMSKGSLNSGIGASGNSNWSNSILRAANFICDKIEKIGGATSEETEATVGSVAMSRGRSVERKDRESDATSRDDSRARFYHHEDSYAAERLRRASRRRASRETTRRQLPPVFFAVGTTNRHPFTTASNLPDPAATSHLNHQHQDSGGGVLPDAVLQFARSKLANITTTASQRLTGGGNAKVLPRRVGRNNDGNGVGRSVGGLRKSCSISDFAPHWTEKDQLLGRDVVAASQQPDLPAPAGQPQPQQLSSFTIAANIAANLRMGGRSMSREPRKRSLSRSHGGGRGTGEDGRGGVMDYARQLPPLPTHMTYDLKNVMRMTEIKTDIGFARAFVRLALERKLLHKHLKAVLSDTQLLQKMYKRYAFLRCEDEREQFLYHVLSLNAVDFSCFTHTFISTKIRYEVLLVANVDRFASSSIWIMLTGSLGSTTNINLPANSLQFTFDVIVRDNITAKTFCFNCGRWFGRGVDDGALERLLVAETYFVDTGVDADAEQFEFDSVSFGNGGAFANFISRPESPVTGALAGGCGGDLNAAGMRTRGGGNFAGTGGQNFYSTGSLTRRRRSPSVGRSGDYSVGATITGKPAAPKISELQHRLGMSVNALVKHFFTDKDYRSGPRLTPLLCGEKGLVPCLEQVFELGRQDTLFSNRFFRQPYPWDYIEKVFAWFATFFRNGESRKLTREQRSLIIYAYNLVIKISANVAVGKEGKFHIFILLTLRDHILSGLLPLMAWTPVTAQIYDESAFLRQPHQLTYLSKLLNSLNEFTFTLEKSLIYGIEL